MVSANATFRPIGVILHSARLYDATVWLALRGRERQLRQRLLDLSGVRAGESVLDVGCGTGNLVILAKGIVGPRGIVCGVDPSREMLVRARSKAVRAGVEIRFENAAGQALPFPDSAFDLALGTMMLHHLGRAARQELAAELRRVVKPGGRVLLADFGSPAARKKGLLRHFRHRHGHVDVAEIVQLLADAGFQSIESGAVGIKDLHFALATSPIIVPPRAATA